MTRDAVLDTSAKRDGAESRRVLARSVYICSKETLDFRFQVSGFPFGCGLWVSGVYDSMYIYYPRDTP